MADFNSVKPYYETHRSLPSPYGDNTPVPARGSHRGELFTQQIGFPRHAMADEGSYFFAQNATIDAATTLAGHAAPVLANLYTKAFLYLRNNDVAASKLRVYLDWILIEVITAGANGTSDNWAAELDTGPTRLSSGGTALTVVNPNMQSSSAPVLTTLGGAVVLNAASAAQRLVGHGVFRPSIGITGDKYTFIFGGDPKENNVVATAITHHIVPMPPVILGPTDAFALHLYAPSQSAAGVYKVKAAWSER